MMPLSVLARWYMQSDANANAGSQDHSINPWMVCSNIEGNEASKGNASLGVWSAAWKSEIGTGKGFQCLDCSVDGDR